MATKNHVDSSVAERRLRPIYNWLDDGNNKKALQEAEKVLKKQPNFQCAKVLKGLALLRLGKENECQELIESVRKEFQCDDSTLQAMTICYREMNKPEEICEIYSLATKKDPKNEELLTHLFMAYVRICDYKKQQQTAMSLYKLKFQNHYYFWTVMSIVMQAHEAGPELAKSLQLPLAEKMVQKFVEDKKIKDEKEVLLYLMILEMQDKLAGALDVLEGPLGEMLHSYIVVPVKKIELLVKMSCWNRANAEIKKILIDDLDNWSLYLNYFKTVFHIAEIESKNEVSESVTSIIGDCVSFLTEVQKKNENGNHRLRGPNLAAMEFFVQLLDHGMDPEMHFGYFTDLLLVYFKNFGSKTCCLNDLQPYLDRLSETQVTTFLDEIWKFIELEDGQLPTSKEQMLRYISNLHITRYLGYHEKLGVKDKILLADCLLRYYIHGGQFNGTSLLSTDIRHNDPFVILIVEIMNDIWLETGEGCYIKNAIVVLEYALEKSPSNHQFKVLLIKLYNILGISKGAHNIYELLDVKHVQLDSLGHLQCWSLISTGQYFLASHLFEVTLKFFTINYKDSADNLTFLYKFGSFLKINEFIEFREKLNNSLHYTAVTVDKMLLEIFLSPNYANTIHLIEQMAISPEKESIQFDKLEDNRDLDLCWTSDPKNRLLTKEHVKTTFEHDVELLRVRSLTLRILAGAVQIASSHRVTAIVNGNKDNHNEDNSKNEYFKTLEALSLQLANLLSSIVQKNLKRLPKNVINAPVESRLFYLLELPYISLVETLTCTLLTLSSKDLNKIENISDQNPIIKLIESISLLRTECKSSDLSQLGLRCRILNTLTLLVEMGSITCLFCGACFDIVKPHINHQMKKSKKKKDTAAVYQVKKGGNDKDTVCLDTVRNLISLTISTLEDLDDCVTCIEDRWKDQESSENDLTDSMNMLSITDIGLAQFCGAKKIMSDSYQSSLSEIHYVIKVKIKYLSELQLL